MKCIMRLLVGIALLIGIRAEGQTTIPGLVARYPLDGNGADTSGYANHGTSFGSVSATSNRFGNPGGACSFAGGFISVPDNDQADLTGDFTIAVWVKMTGPSGHSRIVGKHNSGPDDDGTWALSEEGGRIIFQGTVAGGHGFDGNVGTSTITPGEWTYVAFTFQRSTGAWNFFVNGQPVSNGTRFYDVRNTPNDLLIGAEGHPTLGYTWFWDGSIDDIAIYNRALTANEVLAQWTPAFYASISPTRQTVPVGGVATFTASFGALARPTQTSDITYQWYKDGIPLDGAVGPNFSTPISGSQEGGVYSVKAFQGGVKAQALATLAVQNSVLSIVARPLRDSVFVPARRDAQQTGITVITHGWCPASSLLDFDPEWIFPMAVDLEGSTPGGQQGWTFLPLAWSVQTGALTASPWTARNNAVAWGTELGQQILEKGYTRVHLIGHSAGSNLIQAACDVIKASPNGGNIVVHLTFLDAFTPLGTEGRYGQGANFAEQYFTHDWATYGGGLRSFAELTEANLTNAVNYSVTALDEAGGDPSYFFCGPGSIGSPADVCSTSGRSTHSFPITFYSRSIHPENAASPDYAQKGFKFSQEKGGEGFWPAERDKYAHKYYLGTGGFVAIHATPGQTSLGVVNPATLSQFGSATGSGTVTGSTSPLIGLSVTQAHPRPNRSTSGGPSPTGNAAMMSVAVPSSVEAHYVRLLVRSTIGANSRNQLSMFWNGQPVGLVGSQGSDSFQSVTFAVPTCYTDRDNILDLCLDQVSADAATIEVGEIELSVQPDAGSLRVAREVSTGRLLALVSSGPPAASFLLESTTDLIEWKPLAFAKLDAAGAQVLRLPFFAEPKRFFRIKP